MVRLNILSTIIFDGVLLERERKKIGLFRKIVKRIFCHMPRYNLFI